MDIAAPSSPTTSRLTAPTALRRTNTAGSVQIHAAALILVGLTHIFIGEPRVTLAVGGGIMLVTYLYLGFCEANRCSLFFSPLSYYFFWNCVGLGISPIYLSQAIGARGEIQFSVVHIPLEDLASGYVIYLIGGLALHYGLFASRPPRTSVPAQPTPMPGLFATLIKLWILGILILVFKQQLSFLGSLMGMLRWLPHSVICTFAILPVRTLQITPAKHRVITSLGVVCLLIMNSSSLSKAYMMLSFLPVVWMLVRDPSFRKWRWPAAVAFMAFYFAIIAPTITWLRTQPHLHHANPLAKISASSDAWIRGDVYALRNVDSFSFADSAGHLLVRQFESVSLGYIVGYVADHGHEVDHTLEYAKYALIPRVFWPGKPRLSRGAWFTMHLGFSETEEDATTSTGLSAPGELYWSFGLPGVLIGMYLIGRLFGHLWWIAGDDPRRQPIHMLLYTLVIMKMPDMAEAISTLAGGIAVYLVFRFVFTFVERRNPVQTRQPLAHPLASAIPSRPPA